MPTASERMLELSPLPRGSATARAHFLSIMQTTVTAVVPGQGITGTVLLDPQISGVVQLPASITGVVSPSAIITGSVTLSQSITGVVVVT